MGLTTMRSPGVSVQEFDISGYISADNASIGAVVGGFNWGPIDEINVISNESKLVGRYGVPTDSCYLSWFDVKNFLEYSRNCKVVRVADKTAVTGALNAIATAAADAVRIDNENDYYTNFANGSASVGSYAAKYAGSLGNSLRVEMADAYSFSGLDPQTIVITSAGSGYTTADDNGDAVTFSAPAAVGGIAATGTMIVTGNVLVGINITNTGTGYKLTDTIVVTIPAPTGGGTTGTATIDLWKYRNQFLTAPSTSEAASRLGHSNDQVHVIVIDEDGQFTGEVGTVLERFPFASKLAGAKTDDGTSAYYKDVINTQSRYVYWMDHPTLGTNWGVVTTPTVFANLTLLSQASLSKGQNGAAVSNDELLPGWDLFKNKETVDVGLLICGAGSGTAEEMNVLKDYVIQNIAEHRKDCIAFISPNMDDVVNNFGEELNDILTLRAVMTSSSFGVFDCNWKYQFDVHNDTFRWLPCCADIAGLCARTDEERDPWWSPAGYNRGHIKNVVKFAWNPDLTDRDELFSNGINPVLTFAGEGSMLFGDKTMLTMPSAFDHINVRRLFIILEKSIAKSAKYQLFEFNDVATRLKFVMMVEPFLRQIQGARGIIDYLVICNETNNTGQVIDTNSFVADIYIKPNKSINYIRLNFIATPTGIDFTTAVTMYKSQNSITQ